MSPFNPPTLGRDKRLDSEEFKLTEGENRKKLIKYKNVELKINKTEEHKNMLMKKLF